MTKVTQIPIQGCAMASGGCPPDSLIDNFLGASSTLASDTIFLLVGIKAYHENVEGTLEILAQAWDETTFFHRHSQRLP